jgi:penicillin-binding protein 1C
MKYGSVVVLLGRRRVRVAIAVLAIVVAAGVWLRVGPLPAGLLDERQGTSTVVVDRAGRVLYEALSEDGTRTGKLTADRLPPMLVAATLAAEDRRFWSHPGVDLISIARAIKTNLSERRVVEGGSTISQQVAKLLLNRQAPKRHRGWRAKIQEAVLAVRLEHRFPKRELLAMYLNLANYGNQIAGVERASRVYFGAPASMLTPAQAAFLAGLPQRPSGFNPYRSRDAATARQKTVLRRMEAIGALSATQAREAGEERLTFARSSQPFAAPHFVEMVLEAAGDPRPARIETTLDGELQADVAGIIESHRALLRKHGAANVAVVVLDNASGGWLAWEGSGDYFDAMHGGTINGPIAPRQPGSALKPFTYALAFEQGFSPASVLADVPSHFPTAEPGVSYFPRNYDGKYRGPMLARRALAGSENVPAVALASQVGVPNLLRFLQRAGLSTFDNNAAYYGLGVTLGNAEVRLDELVAAYAAFARGGEWLPPRYGDRPPNGDRPPIGDRPPGRLVSTRTAFWITDILSDPEAREYIFGRGGSLEFPFPVAVKTGTSQAYHDNWTIGYSRHVTVGVWVGNFDRTPLRNSSGVTGAGPIFHAVMLAAERRAGGRSMNLVETPIVAPPADAVEHEICGLSGQAANAWCPMREREWIAANTPLLPCSWHHLGDEGLLTIWPPEYQEWVRLRADSADRYGGTVRLASGGAESPARMSSSAGRAPLTIVNPSEGATYLIDPTLRREFQTLPLKVVAASRGTIEWSVNGKVVGREESDRPFHWPLETGRHRITARDERGRTAETTLLVR